MANVENTSIWDKIQRNVQDVERLVGQKKYNLSMSKARQTLEYMVKLQCDKAGIVEGSLENMIRELYETNALPNPRPNIISRFYPSAIRP